MARKATTRPSRIPSALPALIRTQSEATASDLLPLLAPGPARTSPPATSATPVTTAQAPVAERRSPELPAVTREQRRRLIAQAAYQRAVRAGLGTTDPLADWLHAEREIDAQLALAHSPG